jgi:hypothetical protein
MQRTTRCIRAFRLNFSRHALTRLTCQLANGTAHSTCDVSSVGRVNTINLFHVIWSTFCQSFMPLCRFVHPLSTYHENATFLKTTISRLLSTIAGEGSTLVTHVSTLHIGATVACIHLDSPILATFSAT